MSCICKPDSIIKYDYDNILQHPICEGKCENLTVSCNNPKPQPPKCRYKLFNYSGYNVKTKNIQIYSTKTQNSQACDACNAKTHTLYNNEYCIPNSPLKLFQGYANFRASQSIFANLKFLTYFCQQIKNSTACNHLANLCVLSSYSLDKYSPCTLFFQVQQIDEIANGNVDGEYVGRLRPSIFYKKGKQTNENIEKFIDQVYSLENGKNTFNLTKITFDIDGNLKRHAKIEFDELNLCERYSVQSSDGVRFGVNRQVNCKLKLSNLVHDFKEMEFYDLYLDYFENDIRLLKSIPVLIKNLFSYNHEVSSCIVI